MRKLRSLKRNQEKKYRGGFWRTTIRRQILLAFLAMSVITSTLGFFAVRDLDREGELVDRTFDRSLMSINYARASAADFSALQAAFTRQVFTEDRGTQIAFTKTIADLETAMDEDLSIAVDRAQSVRAINAAKRVQRAIAAWNRARKSLLDSHAQSAWQTLDRLAADVAQQFDLLINYTAGDGFTYRQMAHATVRQDRRFNICATALAVLTSGFVAWLLAGRIVGTIGQASEIARRIAEGELDVIVPVGGSDELGSLLRAMETMRGNIKSSMEREIALRRSAQTRLADALESSCEGVIVIDADAKIVLANSCAWTLLKGVCAPICMGDPAGSLIECLTYRSPQTESAVRPSTRRELELPGGRWLHISEGSTADGGKIIVYSDMTVVKRQEAALRATNLWLDAALANLSQGVCLFDADKRLKVFNQRLCEIFGLAPSTISAGMSLEEVIDAGFGVTGDAAAKVAFLQRIERRVAKRQPVRKLLKLPGERTLALIHQPLEDNGWLTTYEDVTERLEADRKIAFMARHDVLTGLPNRALFAEGVETALAAARHGASFALLCLDLDHFKQVNDSLGHPIGDELLRVIGTRLKSCVSGMDLVARLGGDEFAIIRKDLRTMQDAARLAQRLIDALSAPVDIDGNRMTVGVSIGISVAPNDGSSCDKLLKNADMALYRAKSDGRNNWRFFEPTMDDLVQARRSIELDLREALANDQFEVRYQPFLDIRRDEIVGFEALLRWHHPVRGLVMPSEFISLAEEIGLIGEIGDWVLRQACREAVRWPDQTRVAVNVSAVQFRDGRLFHKVVEALLTSGLSAPRLELEITESVLLSSSGNPLAALKRLRDVGVKISMDDFGTGYSSLSYLRSFPFDKVKIDRSFTCDAGLRPQAGAIVRTIIALCGSLGMKTTAEGVETEAQLAFLKEERCDEVQGYLFSEAVSANEVGGLLASRQASAIIAEAAA